MGGGVLIGLVSIVVLGITAQWLAWRLRLPSILMLLAFGILAGPVTGFLNPDKLLGDLLLPCVSLSVAIILFEGGLGLRVRELRDIGGTLLSLTTVGVLITWLVSALAAWWLLGFNGPLAILLGAILVLTGPTVIGPLLRYLRLRGRAAVLLRWEGIVIDPVGAMLAVLVFEAVLAGELTQATTHAIVIFGKMALIGSLLGLVGAAALLLPLRRFWIPDSLHNPVSLMTVVGVFALSNRLQAESGLVAVIVMGIALANQRSVPIKHIMNFKENLTLLLISSLFIVLGGRLQRSDLTGLGLDSALFLAVLIMVARPAAVLAATARSRLNARERLFLCCMAPRGVVAAAVSSIFALEVAGRIPQAERLVPVTFLVIIGTVTIYGLGAAPLARRLRLAQPNPQGILFVGAHAWARALAATLQAEGYPVLMADSNWSNASAARLVGLPIYYGSVLSEHALDDMELGELGHMLALTSNDEVNSLACLRFAEFFGRHEVHQLPFKSGQAGRREAVAHDQRGRFLFGPELTYWPLQERFGHTPTVKVTRFTLEFDYQAFQAMHGDAALPVMLIKEKGDLVMFTANDHPVPQPGQTVLSLMQAPPAPQEPIPATAETGNAEGQKESVR